MVNQLNWGDPSTLQSGGWDDFDGTISSLKYEVSDYGKTQIAIEIKPERYEHEKRGFTYDPDATTGWVLGWYPLGNVEPEISEDGLDAVFESGKTPYKNTRGVKLIQGIVDHSKATMSGASLRPLIGQKLHWKQIEENVFNPTTQVSLKKEFLYAVSPTLGSPNTPSVSTEVQEKAVSLINDIFSDPEITYCRTSRLAELASKYDYDREVVEFTCSDEGVQYLIDVGTVQREDDRTIKM